MVELISKDQQKNPEILLKVHDELLQLHTECIKVIAAIYFFEREWRKDAVFDAKLEASLDFYKEAVQRTDEVLSSYLGRDKNYRK